MIEICFCFFFFFFFLVVQTPERKSSSLLFFFHFTFHFSFCFHHYYCHCHHHTIKHPYTWTEIFLFLLLFLYRPEFLLELLVFFSSHFIDNQLFFMHYIIHSLGHLCVSVWKKNFIMMLKMPKFTLFFFVIHNEWAGRPNLKEEKNESI